MSSKHQIEQLDDLIPKMSQLVRDESRTWCDVGKWPNICATMAVGTNPAWLDMRDALVALKRAREFLMDSNEMRELAAKELEGGS